MDLKKVLGVGAVFAMGFALTVAGPAQAATPQVTTPQITTPHVTTDGAATIYVPSDFVSALSDTRSTGHYEVAGTGLHIWTEGATSSDKVAEYVATNKPLAEVGEPSLDYVATAGTIPPGFQLVVDFNGDGSADGILVGETIYSGDWWASSGSLQFVKDGAPSHEGGSGSSNHGTLDQWRTAFPNAIVQAFGFSLGSGVLGDWTLNAINFAGTHYTFANSVVLDSKNECKSGGWATSTIPVFRNQGDCVSYFASAKH
ncbi:MAG: hypothetical protein ABI275_00240 [Terrimesophilobacter sp.]